MSSHHRSAALTLCSAAVLMTACATAPVAAPGQSSTAPSATAPAAGPAPEAAQTTTAATAQGRLQFGRPVEGRLTTASPTHEGYPYNDWVFTGQSGERVVIELRSPDFDTFVTVGIVADGEFLDYATNDDGYDDDLDSRLVFPILDGADYVVRVQSYDGEELGAYSLLLTRSSLPAVRSLTPGTTIDERFTLETPSFSDGEFYELWSFEAQQGRRYTFDLRSDDFDTYIVLGRLSRGNLEDLAEDDDGGDGTNSLIRDWVAPQSGTFVLMVESYDGGEGRYTLLVTATEG